MLTEWGVINLGTYLLGALFIILLPGPNSLFVLTSSATKGVKIGYQAALGILAGDTILLMFTAAGAGTLLQAVPLLFYGLQVVGAVYLLYLGVMILWTLVQPANRSIGDSVVLERLESNRSYFHRALVLSLLNPKAILFLLSFFVQFVDPSFQNPWLAFLALGAFLQLFSLLYLSALIFGGSKLASTFRKYPRLSLACNIAVALLFIGFAVRMAFGVG